MRGDFSRITFRPKKHYDQVLLQQGRVLLDSDWNEQGDIQRHRAQTEALDVIGAFGAPRGNAGYRITAIGHGEDLQVHPGRMYVGGRLCQLDEQITYLSQAGGPEPLAPQAGRTDIVYLDVWDRHVSHVEDASLREPALGGADTTTRVQTVAQVRMLKDAGFPRTALQSRAWLALQDEPPARLTTFVQGDPADAVTPGRAYQGVDNRLYRVEVHDGGPLEQATFKWSRDNGSVAYPILQLFPEEGAKHTSFRVPRFGRDQVTSIAANDWVELLDDEMELAGRPGILARVDSVDARGGVVHLATPIPRGALDLAKGARVRRWDQRAAEGSPGVLAITERVVELEDGVGVRFSGGPFRTGDHWTFAARAARGEVESLRDAAPQGVRHHLAPLAIISWRATPDGVRPEIEDVRKIFDTLVVRSLPGRTATVGNGIESAGDFRDIQSAVDSLAHGGRVLIQDGEYTLQRTIVVTRNDIIISGTGPRARVIAPKGEAAFRVDRARDVTFENVTAITEAADAVIIARDTERLTVRDCQLTNIASQDLAARGQRHSAAERSAIRVENGKGVSLLGNALLGAPAASVRAEDVRFGRNELTGGTLWLRDGTQRAIVHENRFVESDGAAVRVGGSSIGVTAKREPVRSVHVVHNDFVRTGGAAVSIGGQGIDLERGGFQDFVIDSNRFRDCVQTSVRGDATDVTGVVAARNVRRLHVVRNHFELARKGVTDCAALAAASCADVAFSQNVVHGREDGPAVVTLQGEGLAVEENWIHGGGVHILDASRRAAVERNRIAGYRGDAIVLGEDAPEFQTTPEVGVRDVTVEGNDLTRIGGCGVVTRGGRPGREGRRPHERLLVKGNRLSGVATFRPPGLVKALAHVLVAHARGVTIEANTIDAEAPEGVAPAGIVTSWCSDTVVSGNTVRARGLADGVAIAVRGEREQVARNVLEGAGLWIRDGSRETLVDGNRIVSAAGAAIRLGGLADTDRDDERAGGIERAQVRHNDLMRAAGAGIVTIRARAHGLEGGGLARDVTLAGNRIEGCAGDGIWIAETAALRVLDNTLVRNSERGRGCGILVERCEGVDVSRNVLEGNGPTQAGPPTAWQGGLVLLDVVAHGASLAAAAAARVHENRVDQPRGHALFLTGLGAMSVQGNELLARGRAEQPEGRGAVATCVHVKNIGRAPDEIDDAVDPQNIKAYQVAGGRVLFQGNLVTYLPDDEGSGDEAHASAVVVASDDDVAVQNNQFLTRIPGARPFASVYAVAATLRVLGNRFTDIEDTVAFSFAARATRTATCAGNHATHPLLVEGTSRVARRDNEVLRPREDAERVVTAQVR